MSRREYLIDGYNLLHTAGFSRVTYGPGDLHRARTRLLWLLAEHLDDDSRRQITLIFDARDPPPELASETWVHQMRVRFSVETGEADALMEELIAEHSSPKQLWVVSSDQRIIAAAKRRKARSLTSDLFLDRLFAGRIGHSRPATPGEEETPPKEWGSTQEWLAFFGLNQGEVVRAAVTPVRPLPIPSIPAPGKNDSASDSPSPSDAKTGGGQSKGGGGEKTKPAAPANGAGFSEELVELDARPRQEGGQEGEVGEEGSWTAELSFWQRRIDELFAEFDEAEEGQSSERKPEKH